MATVTIQWKGHPPCGEKDPPYVGQQYYLFLDQSLFESNVTHPILATFVSEGPGGSGYDKTYTFEFPDTSIPNGLVELEGCHIKDVECVSSCCALLTQRVADLEEFGDQYVVSGEHILEGNFLRLTRNDAVNVDIPIEPFSVSGGNATNDFSGGAGTVHLGDNLHFFSEGGLSISVLGGIGDVQIEPQNITVSAVPGAPAAPPADASRPAVHFSEGVIYYWNPTTVAWTSLTPAPPRVLSDFVGTPAGPPATIDVTASNSVPTLYWSRDDTALSRLWAWDIIAQQWEPAHCCPDEALVIPAIAFADPQAPLEAEWDAYILANSNGVAGQTFIYNRAGQGGTAGNPDYTFLDTDGSGAVSIAIQTPGKPRVLTGAVAPVGAPSTIDFNASDAQPALYWSQDVAADTRLWAWNPVTVAWEAAQCCPVCPISLLSTAFVDPLDPTSVEIIAAVTAASNGIPGQLFIYNRPFLGGSFTRPDYVFVDSDGSGTCPVEILIPSVVDVEQPFQVVGDPQDATNATPVAGGVDAYRTGATLIGGADGAPVRSLGTRGIASNVPQFEVLSTFASGAGNHTVTGGNAGILGGSLGVAAGLHATVSGGISNEANHEDSHVGGGNLNLANGPKSGILGGTGNETTGFRCAIAGGQSCLNSGQQSLVTGDENNNSGISAFVCGALNGNTGHTSNVLGSLNTNASDASLVGGTGNDVSALADASCLVGSDNIWGCSRSLGGGDDNVSVGFGSLIIGLGNDTNTQSSATIGSLNVVTASYSLVNGRSNVVGIAVPVSGVADTLVSGNSVSVADGVVNGVALGGAPRLLHSGSFIFSGHAAALTPTVAASSFTAHVGGGARFLTDAAGTVGAELIPGATAWSVVSLREKKTEIVSVTSALEKVNQLGVYEYSYKDASGDPLPLMEMGEVSRRKGDLRKEAVERFKAENKPVEAPEEVEPPHEESTKGQKREYRRYLKDLRRFERYKKGSDASPKPDDDEEITLSDWTPTGRPLRQMGPMADGEDGWAAVVGTGAADSIPTHDMAALALAAIKELAAQLEEAKVRISQLEARLP